VRRTSRDVLARAASYGLRDAACKYRAEQWNAGEAKWAAASSQADAAAAAAPLLRVCAGCPIVAQCHSWALTDMYSGIAAGTAWVNGVERPASWVYCQRGPRGSRRVAS
jgi:hypothetical protein